MRGRDSGREGGREGWSVNVYQYTKERVECIGRNFKGVMLCV